MPLNAMRLAWAARLAALTPPHGRGLIAAPTATATAAALAEAMAAHAIEWLPATPDQIAEAELDCLVIEQGLGDSAPISLDAAAQRLKPGGVCGVATYLGPEDEKAADYLQAMLALRDPAQKPLWSMEAWERDLFAAGLLLTEHSVARRALDFDEWIDASPPVTPLNRLRLRAMLRQAPRAVHAYLTPIERGDRITFHLQAGFLISLRPANA